MKHLELLGIFAVLIGAVIMHNNYRAKHGEPQKTQNSIWEPQPGFSDAIARDLKRTQGNYGNSQFRRVEFDVRPIGVPRRDIGRDLDAMKSR